MATIIIIDNKLKKDNLNERINLIFDNNPSSYGIKRGEAKCQKWVRLSMEDLGLKFTGELPDAWEFFAKLPNSNIKYFKRDKINSISDDFSNKIKSDKNNNGRPLDSWSNNDLLIYSKKLEGDNKSTINGSFLFGFYATSNHLEDSKNTINNIGKDKIDDLKNNAFEVSNSKNLGMNVITHVGIFINSQYFNFAQALGIMQNPTPSFYPVAWYPFLSNLKKKI